MLNVLIADDDRTFSSILSRTISANTSFNLIGTLFDGESALDQIKQKKPDVIILDIIMPGYDGIYIIEQLRQQEAMYHPYIYVLSGIGSNKILNAVNTLDIDYFILKPVSVDMIMHKLNRIAESKDELSLQKEPVKQANVTQSNEEMVNLLSKQFGMLPHRKSTQCLNSAIIYCLENPNGIQQITKVLYPEIAKRTGLSGSAVERNIRQAIWSIQKTGTPLFDQIFAYTNNKRLTNGEFLAIITEYLSLQSGQRAN